MYFSELSHSKGAWREVRKEKLDVLDALILLGVHEEIIHEIQSLVL